MGLFSKFFGGAAATGAGFAFGHAAGPVLSPAVQELRNEAWTLYQTKPLEAGGLAVGVAQGKVDEGWAKGEAAKTGISPTRFDELVIVAKTGPGAAAAFELFRRNITDEKGFRRALKRLGLEDEWINDLVKLKDEILTPGELAAAIHRGLVPDPGILKGEQPTAPFKVEAYPVYPIPTLAEAAGSGIDPDRLGVLVGLQGLPMGTHEAAQAYFREIITHGDYIRAFNESNSRNEWAQAVLDQSRQIPTARDFLENALRGYSNLQEAIAGAARHGMSTADATLIYQNQGRPMNVHQITQALARGAKFHPEPGEITDPYRASTVEGPLKPAYYEMNEALKYVVPGVFAIRALTESGVWSEAKAAERLKWSGWFPPDADEVAKAWATPKAAGAKVDPLVGKAESKLFTVVQKAYTEKGITKAQAVTALDHLTTDAAVQAKVFEMWDAAVVVLFAAPPA